MTMVLEDVQAELRAKGYVWHFFGPKTSVGADGVTRYWFNGSQFGTGRGRLTSQPYGWYTLDEMRAEAFRHHGGDES